jgi:hypothetical protein
VWLRGDDCIEQLSVLGGLDAQSFLFALLSLESLSGFKAQPGP